MPEPPLALVLVDMTNMNMLICAVCMSHMVAAEGRKHGEIVQNWRCSCHRSKRQCHQLTVLAYMKLLVFHVVDYYQLACAGYPSV